MTARGGGPWMRWQAERRVAHFVSSFHPMFFSFSSTAARCIGGPGIGPKQASIYVIALDRFCARCPQAIVAESDPYEDMVLADRGRHKTAPVVASTNILFRGPGTVSSTTLHEQDGSLLKFSTFFFLEMDGYERPW